MFVSVTELERPTREGLLRGNPRIFVSIQRPHHLRQVKKLCFRCGSTLMDEMRVKRVLPRKGVDRSAGTHSPFCRGKW